MKYQVKRKEDLNWEEHPFLKPVKFKYLITKAKDNIDLTLTFVKVEKGVDIPAHVHDTQDDIIYCLQGSMKVWIEGEGDIPLETGALIRIPKGIKHKPFGHSEDFVGIDLFVPAMV